MTQMQILRLHEYSISGVFFPRQTEKKFGTFSINVNMNVRTLLISSFNKYKKVNFHENF